MYDKKKNLSNINEETYVDKGHEKRIYEIPESEDEFVGLFKKARTTTWEGTYEDIPLRFTERPGFIKALYYVNNLAALLMPGLVRNIKQSGVTEEIDNEDAEHVFVGKGFIPKRKYKSIPIDDVRTLKARETFEKTGFHYDPKSVNPNLAESIKGSPVYIDTVAPWWYMLQGVAHEKTSVKGGYTHGMGYFEEIYKPTPLFDEDKIKRAIEKMEILFGKK